MDFEVFNNNIYPSRYEVIFHYGLDLHCLMIGDVELSFFIYLLVIRMFSLETYIVSSLAHNHKKVSQNIKNGTTMLSSNLTPWYSLKGIQIWILKRL